MSGSSVVNVFVISADTRSERRFDLHTTVEQLKAKLEPITGIPVANQIISLINSETDGQLVSSLTDDSKQLGFYGLRDWQVLKVDDANPSVSFTGQLTDVSQVEKFELSDAEYAKRQDSILAYKQRHKVGRFAPKEHQQSDSPVMSVDIPIGSRCEVESDEAGLHKRGIVRFVGLTKFGNGEGVWVGIEYDEPLGKNDGSVQGERYFTCRPSYGAFVRPDRVRIGDFPVVDIEEEM